MNLRDLEYIVTVAELKSFVGASKKCFVSQPTLSSQIKKLEEELQVNIFERNNKQVSVTETGAEVIAIAKRMLADAKLVKEVAVSKRDPLSGTLNLCAIPTISSYAFPKLVKKIKTELPKVKLILSEEKTEALFSKLRAGEIDFGIAAKVNHKTDLKCEKLFFDPFYLVVQKNHELAKKSKVNLSNINLNELLLLEDGHCLGDQVTSICKSKKSNYNDELKSTSIETLRQMVLAGTGVTLIPKLAIDNKDKALGYVPLSEKNAGRDVCLFSRKTTSKKIIKDKLIQIINSINFV